MRSLGLSLYKSESTSLRFSLRTSNTAAFVDLKLRFLTACSEPDLSGKIDVAHFQKAVIDVVVDRLLAAHQFILMCDIDLVDRMPLFYERGNDLVKALDFFLTGREAASGLGDDFV